MPYVINVARLLVSLQWQYNNTMWPRDCCLLQGVHAVLRASWYKTAWVSNVQDGIELHWLFTVLSLLLIIVANYWTRGACLCSAVCRPVHLLSIPLLCTSGSSEGVLGGPRPPLGDCWPPLWPPQPQLGMRYERMTYERSYNIPVLSLLWSCLLYTSPSPRD